MSKQPSDSTAKVNWHRLFGMFLTDFFTDSPFVVETEKDLSVHLQLLDVVIVRKQEGPFHEPLPDGLTDLVNHNLISFKSFQETLDAWALKELVGHYVNYRKQLARRNQPLLPEEQFRLYAVCSRRPEKLAKEVALQPVQEGVFECLWGNDRIRIVVAGQLPQVSHNAPLHLFSAQQADVRFAVGHCRLRSEKSSTLLRQLFEGYYLEGIPMPMTLEEYCREYTEFGREKIRSQLTPEDRQNLEAIDKVVEHLFTEEGVNRLSPLEVAKRLLFEEVLKRQSPEVLLKLFLPPEKRIEGLSPEQRIEGLSTEDLERLLQQRRATGLQPATPGQEVTS